MDLMIITENHSKYCLLNPNEILVIIELITGMTTYHLYTLQQRLDPLEYRYPEFQNEAV